MFLKDRMQKKIIPFFDLSAYKVMEEEVDAVYLSWIEISLINKLNLSQNQNLEKYVISKNLLSLNPVQRSMLMPLMTTLPTIQRIQIILLHL